MFTKQVSTHKDMVDKQCNIGNCSYLLHIMSLKITISMSWLLNKPWVKHIKQEKKYNIKFFQ